MEEKSDAVLVVLARDGDKRAFGILVERYQPVAERVAGRMVLNRQIALELVQEALLQAYLCLETLQKPASFGSWLYGIVLNLCRGHLRRQTPFCFSLESLAGGMRFEALPFTSPLPTPQEIAEERELHRLVLNAINTLSPANRAATLLFYYEGMSIREVSNALGISVAAVKGRLHKSRRSLREQLLPIVGEQFVKPVQKRRKTMVKVTVVDVVPQARKIGEGENEQTYFNSIIVLLDEVGQRALPIWVGTFEATSIVLTLGNHSGSRPLTYQFMASLLNAADVKLEEVRIEQLKESIYYAVAKICNGEMVREIDARPSDAMALALQLDCPIYVADDVLEESGINLSQEHDITRRKKWVDEMMEARTAAQQNKPKTSPRPPEEWQQTQQELMSLVFGSPSEEIVQKWREG